MDVVGIIVAAIWCAAIYAARTRMAASGDWYVRLKKPRWHRSDGVFKLIGLAAPASASLGFLLAWLTHDSGRLWLALIYGLNAIALVIWCGLFFALRRPRWAAIEAGLLWGSTVALFMVLWPIQLLSIILILPYFAWVSGIWLLTVQIADLNHGTDDRE